MKNSVHGYLYMHYNDSIRDAHTSLFDRKAAKVLEKLMGVIEIPANTGADGVSDALTHAFKKFRTDLVA